MSRLISLLLVAALTLVGCTVTVKNTEPLPVKLTNVVPNTYVIHTTVIGRQSQPQPDSEVRIDADSMLLLISYRVLVMAAPESGGEQMQCGIGTQRLSSAGGSPELLWNRYFIDDDINFFFSGLSDHIRLDPGVLLRVGDTLLTGAGAIANGGFARCDVTATYLLQKVPQ
jgi:hypothetical protein